MVNKFIQDIKAKAEKHGVEVRMVDAKLVYAEGETVGCAGYFCSERKVLAIAMQHKRHEWLGLLAHESSHMDQWVERPYIWKKLGLGYDLFFEWLDGGIKKREDLEEAVQDIIRLEKDCEERAIRKMLNYNLPVNVERYKRRANAYMYAYLYFLETRKWVPRIYSRPEVWSKSPVRFPRGYKKIPRGLHTAFKVFHGDQF